MQHLSRLFRERVRSAALLGALLVSLLAPFSAQAASSAPTAVRITGFPAVQQFYSLSCEYAAAAAVTLYWGNLVSQNVFLREISTNANPHLGFRGDIYGSFGGINDYGIYAEPLVPVLERHGYQASVYYNDEARLLATLRSGTPVVVWLTSGQAIRTPVTRTVAGDTFKLVPGEHALVVYGYNSTGVSVMDVASGTYQQIAWASFLRRWGYFDEMMLVITPADS